MAAKGHFSIGECDVYTCPRVGKSHQWVVGGGQCLGPLDYIWSTGGYVRSGAGKLLGGIRWLLDS